MRNIKTPENRIDLLENLLGAGVWSYDLRTREVTWSPGLFRLIGVDSHAVAASNEFYESLVHPDDRLTHEEIVERARTGELSSRRLRIIRPDGRLIWLESRIDRQYDRQGQMTVLHGVVQDVTAQETLSVEHARLARINASMRKIVGGDFWRTDAEGKLLDLSSWARYTGQSVEQLRDYDQLSAVHPDDRKIFLDTWATAIRTKQKFELSARVRRHDGVYERFLGKIVPIVDGDGIVQEWHGISWLADDPQTNAGTAITLDAAHLRAARALLDWSAQDLASASDVSFSTVRRMEVDTSTVKADNVEKVKRTLEARGVRFIPAPGGHVAVVLVLRSG